MSNRLQWNFNFTPLRDADSVSQGSSRAWGDLGNNIEKFTKWAQKYASDPYDEYKKSQFANLSPEEKIAVMQSGNFITPDEANKVSPQMRDRFRLNDPRQALQWDAALAQMNQQKQAAQIQSDTHDRRKLAWGKEDAQFDFERNKFALEREFQNAMASGDNARAEATKAQYNDWMQSQLQANPHLHGLTPITSSRTLAGMTAHNAAQSKWDEAMQDNRVKALAQEAVFVLGEAAPGSDLQNQAIEWLQQAKNPQEHAERILALQTLQTSGMSGFNVPALMASRDAFTDAEDAAMPYNQAGPVVQGAGGVGSSGNPAHPVSMVPQAAPAQTAGAPSFAPASNVNPNAATINVPPIPHVSASGGEAPTTWAGGVRRKVVDGVVNFAKAATSVDIPVHGTGGAALASQLLNLNKANLDHAIPKVAPPKQQVINLPSANTAKDEESALAYGKAGANDDMATANNIAQEAHGGKSAWKNNPQPAKEEAREQYIAGPLKLIPNGKKVTNPADKTYNSYALNKPLSQSSIGEVVKFQPKLRDHVVATQGIKTSAVGKYQIIEETLARHAKKVFGNDWKNVVFSEANQDLLGQSIYEEAKRNGAIPSKVWAGLAKLEKKKGFKWVNEKGGFSKVDWETAQAALLPLESGAVPLPKTQQPNQQAEIKPDYEKMLPVLQEEYLANAERIFNGGVSTDLQSFMDKGRDRRSAQQILNELGKANSTIKTNEGDMYNTLALDSNTITHTVNKVSAILGKEGIRVSPHQVIDVTLKNALKREGLWGDKDKLGVVADVVVNQLKALHKMSTDPQVQFTQMAGEENAFLQNMRQRLEATNTELTKLRELANRQATNKYQ